MRTMCPNADEALAKWWGERCRAAASPGAARALIEMNSLVDVRDVLASVQAPTLVLHRRNDVDARIDEGRYLAQHIPGAHFIELDGADHFRRRRPRPDPRSGGGLRREAPVVGAESVLATVMAVHARQPIDLRWIRGLAQALLDEHQGRRAVVDGTGVLATFDGPSRAVRCGLALVARGPATNLRLSVGLHTGEITRHGAAVSGPGVTVAQAVAEGATAGEV